MQELDRSRQSNKTIVTFHSDHGWSLGKWCGRFKCVLKMRFKNAFLTRTNTEGFDRWVGRLEEVLAHRAWDEGTAHHQGALAHTQRGAPHRETVIQCTKSLRPSSLDLEHFAGRSGSQGAGSSEKCLTSVWQVSVLVTRLRWLSWLMYLLRGVCIRVHNKSHRFHLILGLNYAYLFPGVGYAHPRRAGWAPTGSHPPGRAPPRRYCLQKRLWRTTFCIVCHCFEPLWACFGESNTTLRVHHSRFGTTNGCLNDCFIVFSAGGGGDRFFVFKSMDFWIKRDGTFITNDGILY